MAYSRHAFISYAHDDNKVLPPAERGWVTYFHEALSYYLGSYIGDEVDIWLDGERISGNTAFAAEILRQFPQTAALVPVLSPSYINSEWCDREINGFYEAATGNGGVLIGTLSRIFKVIKVPVDNVAGLPSAVSDTPGYLFYEVDKDSTPHTLDPALGEEKRRDFLLKVQKLAWDMKKLLAQLGGVVPDNDKPLIYLAECSSDRRPAREAIEREFQKRGYTILPDRRLPEKEEDYRAEVARMMAQCRLSVHLVGSGYGVVPDGPSGKSVVVLQNEIAVEASRRGTLARVISLPAGTKSGIAAQQEFIDRLHNDPDTQFGADLITGGVEELKGTIIAALSQIAAPTVARPAEEKEVVILCTESERGAAAPLIRFLKSRNVSARLPLFIGDEARRRQLNRDILASADAVILFYGANDELWKREREQEIGAARGSMKKVFTYLTAPVTDDKSLLLAVGGTDLIDGSTGFQEESLEPLLAILERK